MDESITRFKAAQERLLQVSGTKATIRELTLTDPAAQVRRVSVVEAGSDNAPPVLMIHGGNSFAAGWEPLLSLLQDSFHIYAPDRPGCGLTDSINYRGIPFQSHGLAFVREVMNKLGLERFSLIGNSMGGYWCLLFALRYPERVQQLALIGEPAGSAPQVPRRLRLIGTPGINRLLFATMLKPRRERTRQQLGVVVAHPERLSEEYLDAVYAGSQLPGANRAWRTMVENVTHNGKKPSHLTYSLRTELNNIQCPTLFLWGERDFCSPQWGEALSKQIPKASLEVLPDAGHMAWLDEPEKIAQRLHAFLQRCSPG